MTVARTRPARRALDELSLAIDGDDLGPRLAGLAVGDPTERQAALDAYGTLPANRTCSTPRTSTCARPTSRPRS